MSNHRLHEQLNQMGLSGLLEVTYCGEPIPTNVQHLNIDLEKMEEFSKERKEKGLQEAVAFIKNMDELDKIINQIEERKYLLKLDFRKGQYHINIKTNSGMKRIKQPNDRMRITGLMKKMGARGEELEFELFGVFSESEALERVGRFINENNGRLLEEYEVLADYFWIEINQLIKRK